ncbi:hypothetical protein GCM10023157_08260 [Gluconacetobacter asukensis]
MKRDAGAIWPNSYEFPMGSRRSPSLIPMTIGWIIPLFPREMSHARFFLFHPGPGRVRRMHRLRGGVCEDLKAMNLDLILGAMVTVGLLAYVTAVLVRPERF